MVEAAGPVLEQAAQRLDAEQAEERAAREEAPALDFGQVLAQADGQAEEGDPIGEDEVDDSAADAERQTTLAAQNARHRKKAQEWLETDPLAGLMTLRTCLKPLTSLL